jgi:hypothetical protein
MRSLRTRTEDPWARPPGAGWPFGSAVSCRSSSDFGPGDVLAEGTARRLTGVIDFDGAGLGDSAVDLAAAQGFGPPEVWAAYLGGEALRERDDARGTAHRGDAEGEARGAGRRGARRCGDLWPGRRRRTMRA